MRRFLADALEVGIIVLTLVAIIVVTRCACALGGH
jgi:hypothetical protein